MSRSDVLMVAHYVGDPGGTNNRFNELAERLQAGVGDVELVTSSFSHRRKQQRVEGGVGTPYAFTAIPEPGYRTNVSLRRIVSHRVFARRVRRYLERRTPPDLLYCAVPSLAAAGVVARYARRRGVPLVLDVQDLWPEAFLMVIRPRWLGRLVMRPVFRRAESVYRAADRVVTVSRTYSDRVLAARGGRGGVSTVHLGTDLERFDRWAGGSRPSPRSGIRLAYIGTLGRSYDLATVFEAMRLAGEAGIGDVSITVMGTGPLDREVRAAAVTCGVEAEFTGHLPYPDMVRRLAACDVAVNPIRSGSAGSVINKVADYAAAGLPVINTQDSSEYRSLLTAYRAGINCPPESPEPLMEAIGLLSSSDVLRRTMGANSRRLAEEVFDRARTYGEIVDLVRRTLDAGDADNIVRGEAAPAN